jgi:hypothetical protein
MSVGWDQRACERRPTKVQYSSIMVGRRSQARWSHPTTPRFPFLTLRSSRVRLFRLRKLCWRAARKSPDGSVSGLWNLKNLHFT